MSYVYIQSERPTHDTTGLWTVGFYDLAGKWHPESDHGREDSAAARVRYLNGGTGAAIEVEGAALEALIAIRDAGNGFAEWHPKFHKAIEKAQAAIAAAGRS